MNQAALCKSEMMKVRPVGSVTYLVSEDWYFALHYLEIAVAAKEAGWTVSLLCRTGQKGSAAAERIRQAGIRLVPISLARSGMNPLHDLQVLHEVTRWFHRLRPDVVHLVALKPILIGAIAARLAGVRSQIALFPGLGHVFTSNALVPCTIRWGIRLFFRVLLRHPSVQVSVMNQDDARALSSFLSLDPERILITPGIGVDVHRFTPALHSSSTVTIAYIGRMLREKGIPELIDAMRILRRQGNSCKLVLAGSPDASNPSSLTQSTLQHWQSEGLCIIAGFVDDIASFLRTVDIVVLPSHREGLGMSLIEASSCELPCVATDVPGCREAVLNGETGFLVPPHDPPRLAEALERLSCDPILRRKMGQRGRAYILSKYSKERVHQTVLGTYEATLRR